MAKFTTIDDYLSKLPADKCEALENLRRIILSAAPGVDECISYDLPAFRLGGKTLLWMGAAANHCALYGVQETRPGELGAYDTSGRGTIRFAPGKPLPAALVRRLVKARIANSAAPKRRA